MINYLSGEKSPYLLQHTQNPVHWYPWGTEAFRRAKEEDKPIFLSIGYSTCHWCHVMAKESFEDLATAQKLNRDFIAIKVDREERPDVDQVYMAVCQAFTGSGGWPTSIFMTPDQQPFFAGTYFPPSPQHGMPSFSQVINTIATAWQQDRAALLRPIHSLQSMLTAQQESADALPPTHLPARALARLKQSFDARYGGFGSAPKFPVSHQLLFLLTLGTLKKEQEAAAMAQFTLTKMRKGGLFDQIGFGFFRYSTDKSYLVPHFEKMLYDNALLIITYCAASAQSQDPLMWDTAAKTAQFLLEVLSHPEGGFFAALDADSGGQEGAYYLFSEEEVRRVLGEVAGARFNRYYNVTQRGNFEGKNIPNRLDAADSENALEPERAALLSYRRSRSTLRRDEKVLCGWNGLMIAALTALYRASGEARYLTLAEKTASFIETHLTRADGHLAVYWKNGSVGDGFLEDYAFVAYGLLALYDAGGKADTLKRCVSLCRFVLDHFFDATLGGFFTSGQHQESLFFSSKDSFDSALPCGNSVLAYLLVRLSRLCPEEAFGTFKDLQLRWLCAQSAAYPEGHTFFMHALLFEEQPQPVITIVLAGKDNPAALLPQLPFNATVRFLKEPTNEFPLLNGQTTYYVCAGFHCLPASNTLPPLDK